MLTMNHAKIVFCYKVLFIYGVFYFKIIFLRKYKNNNLNNILIAFIIFFFNSNIYKFRPWIQRCYFIIFMESFLDIFYYKI